MQEQRASNLEIDKSGAAVSKEATEKEEVESDRFELLE